MSERLPRRPRLVIFDQYKTLTDGVTRDGSDPEREIITEFALAAPYDEVERVVCGTRWIDEEQYLDALVSGLSLSGASGGGGSGSDDVKSRLRAVFARDVLCERVVEEARPVLRCLRERGVRLALLSNAATPAYTHATAPGSGLADLFDVAVYSYELGLVKPDPRTFRRVLELAGVAPEDALMVGDSLRSDVRGALAAGLGQAVLLDRAGRHPEVRPRVDSLQGLLELIPEQEAAGDGSREGVARAVESWAAGEACGAGAGAPEGPREGGDAEDDDDDDDPAAWKERGNAHFKAKRYRDALLCYGEAIDSEMAADFSSGRPFSSQLYCNRSACHLQLGDAEAALLDAGRAVQFDRASGKAYFRKGKAFLALGRHEDALDCLEHARLLSPAADPALDKLIGECAGRTRR